MIDHISLAVSDIARATAFYERALAPLGLTRLITRPATVGFGKSYPELWINLRAGMARLAPDNGVHLGLRARSVAEIDAFYEAAMAAGGTSESPPSVRPHDRVRYYATFIADHDGNRIEAVTFLPQDGAATA